MKKLLSLVCVLSLALCLIACGKKGGTETTYTMSAEGMSMEVVLKSEGDAVKSMEMITEVSTEGASEDEVAMMEPMLTEQFAAPYEGIDGIKCSTDTSDNAIKFTIEFDLTKEAVVKAMAEKGTPGAAGATGSDLSLKELSASLEESGFTKK